MDNKKKRQRIVYFLRVSFLVLVVSVLISKLIQSLLNISFGLSFDEAGTVASLVQGVVAAIAAGLVLFELKNGEELNRHQTEVEEAQFILEYNRSFIENERMTEMERYMECRLTGVDYGEVNSLIANRQDMINYLVYLEGLSTCILGDILDIAKVDNLFSYRFFLAMNHPEVQSVDLLPYATYYRGCFQLYDKWLTYRITSPKYENTKNMDIPLFESSLSYRYGYEKYATPEITTVVGDNYVIGCISGREKGTINWDDTGQVTVDFSGKKLSKNKTICFVEKEKLLNAMLKELIYNEKFITNNCTIYLDEDNSLKCADSMIKSKFESLLRAKEIMYDAGVHFRQLNNRLNLTNSNLNAIAKLIYQTDNYIYPDMFGSLADAVTVLTQLLQSGKDSMFNLDNIFVCELNEEIVGILLWHKGALNWSSEEMLKVMKKREIIPPANLRNVENEYVSGYSEVKDNNMISILNICVADHAKRHRIGQKMLKEFIKEHKEESFELCVLSDNEFAIKLYRSCGFGEYGDKEPAYPESKPNHFRITMRYRGGKENE